MAQQHFLANREIEMVLLALQAFQVLFLWVHDWIPLGRLNDVAAIQWLRLVVRSTRSGRRR
jgi:hypothetical protein